MRRLHFKGFLFGTLLSVMTSAVRADDWPGPQTKEVFSGKVVRSYELSDLFQDEEIKAFGQSVSSIHWRNGPAYIRQDQKTLLITVKSGGDFLFGLETGRFKYCEYQEKTYRCRNTNQPREWMPNSRMQLTR